MNMKQNKWQEKIKLAATNLCEAVKKSGKKGLPKNKAVKIAKRTLEINQIPRQDWGQILYLAKVKKTNNHYFLDS
jgi:hypothetical protein